MYSQGPRNQTSYSIHSPNRRCPKIDRHRKWQGRFMCNTAMSWLIGQDQCHLDAPHHGGCVSFRLVLRPSYREDKLPIMDANKITTMMNTRRTSSGATRLWGFRDSRVPSRGASKSGSISTPIADMRRGGTQSSVSSLSPLASPSAMPTTKLGRITQNRAN